MVSDLVEGPSKDRAPDGIKALAISLDREPAMDLAVGLAENSGADSVVNVVAVVVHSSRFLIWDTVWM
jgi:hypothetical protein